MRRIISLLVVTFVLTLAACQGAPAVPALQTPPIVNEGATMGVLNVSIIPEGAEVLVDGVVRGISPLTLELAPGAHEVTARVPGYAEQSDTITLEAGQEAIYSPDLADVAPPFVQLVADRTEVGWAESVTLKASASDNAGPARLELLLGDETLAVIDEGEYTTTLTPEDTPGMDPDSEVVLTARATDAAGNMSEARVTLRVGNELAIAPTATSQPEPGELVVAATAQPTLTVSALPSESGAVTETVQYEVGEIILPTYPYAAHLSMTTDPLVGDYPVRVLDRAAYDAVPQVPESVRYRLLTLENRYLKLEFLPDLGGRLYGVKFKPTGSQEMYQNAVVKPTMWGPGNPPAPEGANWWPALGGMEWGFPVDEHGYEFGSPWGFDNVTTSSGGGITVNLFTRDPKLPHAVVDITLEPDQASFTQNVRIINPWPEPFRLKWWHIAALAPGPQNTVSEELRFIWPTERARVHSTGDASFASAGNEVSWPVASGRDLSRLGDWTGYLGLFQSPAAQGSFTAVYDPTVDEGMVRSYPPETAQGAKFFSTGWTQALDPAMWTDDGSRYVEMQGGLMPTYDDWYELGPGEEISWSETWFPVAGIGGVTYADANGAMRVGATGKRLNVGVFPTRPVEGALTVSIAGADILSLPVRIAPDQPFMQEFEYSGAEVNNADIVVSLVNRKGETILETRDKITLR